MTQHPKTKQPHIQSLVEKIPAPIPPASPSLCFLPGEYSETCFLSGTCVNLQLFSTESTFIIICVISPYRTFGMFVKIYGHALKQTRNSSVICLNCYTNPLVIICKYSASLNPTHTPSSPINSGRFTSMPSVARSSIISFSLMLPSISFSCSSL